MHRILPRARLLLAIVALLAIAGCTPATVGGGATPTATHTPTPIPQATMVVVSGKKVVANSSQGTYTASASCPAGEPMLSGGFGEGGGTNAQQADTLSSYPSSANTWTAVGSNAAVGGSLTLYVSADCLKANFSVTTSIVTAGPGTGTLTASCPAGSVVTGGGYKGNGAFSALQPSANGWQGISLGATPTTVYAICASGKLAAASTPSVTYGIGKGKAAYVEVPCAAGQLLVGGGYTLAPPAAAFVDNALNGPSGPTSFWLVNASDRSFGSASGLTDTAIAVCVKVV